MINMEETNKTIDYYNSNADQYFSDTVNVDMTECCDRFLKYVVPGGRIIDIGAGSGRDIKYFKDRGYAVEGIDASEEMCRLAADYSGVVVSCERIQDWQPEEKYDGIWANASLLHLSDVEIISFLDRASSYLINDGIMYFSMKEGMGSKYDDLGRLYTFMSDECLFKMLKNNGKLKTIEKWKSYDKMNRDLSWINIILKKV